VPNPVLQKNHRLRLLIIGLLVVGLFINWYFYNDTYEALQALVRSTMVSLGVQSAALINGAKFVSYLFLLFFNIFFSFTIVYTYFLNLRVAKTALGYMLLYFTVTFTATCVFFGLGNEQWYQYARAAADLLASPLVECALIPIMKLKLAEEQANG
jgi:hypothetical protein